ncbi:ribbon-helix-helix domain-containing protein [Microseira sp. BLCC-F43]|uniref:ribbon-helix-helix domain-containing protein n=1 Tax=Microseira sp. BLCC-F43 TaxID=3153602 RepID=UPI0035BACD8A
MTDKKKQAWMTRHGEYKQRVSLMLTPSSIQKLDRLAELMNTSRSELIERWARGLDENVEPQILGKCFAS